jgi:hypothetical protein
MEYSYLRIPLFSLMKKTTHRTITTLAVLLCAALGAGIATVHADDASTAQDCDQITATLKAGRPGTLSYQRMKDQYNRKCLDIKAGCTSAASMAVQVRACTQAGMYSEYYIDPSSCKQVRCTATAPSSASSSSSWSSSSSAASANGPCPNGAMLTAKAVSCKANNQNYEYYTINGCKQIRCIDTVSSQTSCPSPITMQNKAASCKASGIDYEYYTIGVCKMVRCLNEGIGADAVTCANDAAINAAGVRCTARGLKPVVSSDTNGCRQVTCKASTSSATSSCPSDDQLDQGIKVCKNSGQTGTTMQDNNGCRQVICQSMRQGSSSSRR